MDKNLNSTKSVFLSIIIPVYNVESYLSRCLDSILYQSVNFKYEIIVVNDCSTDSSLSLLIDYEKNFENIKIVDHECNKKLSVARKSGIELSQGVYVMHVDSDDWLIDGCLEYIYNILSDSLYDVVAFNYFTEDIYQNRKLIDLIKNDILVTDCKSCQNFFLGAPWNKVIKRELLSDDLIYGVLGINNGEDLVYSTEIFLKTQNIFLSSYSFYVYFVNLKSLTKVNNSIIFLSNQLVVIGELSKVFVKYNVDPQVKKVVIDYFLNFIFVEIFNYNFKPSIQNKKVVFDTLFNIVSSDSLSTNDKETLIHSINSKWFSLLQVLIRFGVKKTIGFLLIKN